MIPTAEPPTIPAVKPRRRKSRATREDWDIVMSCYVLLSELGYSETAGHLSNWLVNTANEGLR